MAATKNENQTSEQETNVLLEEVLQNESVLFGKRSTKHLKAEKIKAWQTIADKVNAVRVLEGYCGDPKNSIMTLKL